MIRYLFGFAGVLVAARGLDAQAISDFFDDSVLQEIRLTMKSADWQNTHDHYLDKKTYYSCDFTWHGIVVKNAGLHTRGTGSLNPIKPGLGIEFAKNVPGQTFLGMDSVILRNFSEDPTGLHERLAMHVFQRLGTPYLRTMHAKMFVNDQYVGLYEVVEPIDARFLTTRFGESTGYLYEAVGGLNYHFEYMGDNPSSYIPVYFDPKTHSDDPQGQVFVNLVRTINQATDAGFLSAMSPYMDVGAFTTYAAAETFLAENDGLLTLSGMTNFYLYRRSLDDRWFLVPWDRELTFTSSSWSIWQFTQENVLLRRALAIPEMRQRYLDALHLAADLIGGPGGWLDTEVEREYQQIHQAMLDDPNRVCDIDNVYKPCPAQNFEDAIVYLRYFPKERADFVKQSLQDAGWSQNAQAPALAAGSIGNAASGVTLLAPGELAAVQVNFPVASEQRAQDWPLPTELAQVSVKVAGVSAPLIAVSPSGAWFQTPSELPSGPASVAVAANGIAGPTVPIEIRPANPGVFAVAHTNGDLVTAGAPARSGELVVVWATGLGRAKSNDQTGQAAPLGQLVAIQNSVTAAVNGNPADVTFAGLAPGYAGLQIIVLKLPNVTSENGHATLVLSIGGEPGAAYSFSVR